MTCYCIYVFSSNYFGWTPATSAWMCLKRFSQTPVWDRLHLNMLLSKQHRNSAWLSLDSDKKGRQRNKSWGEKNGKGTGRQRNTSPAPPGPQLLWVTLGTEWELAVSPRPSPGRYHTVTVASQGFSLTHSHTKTKHQKTTWLDDRYVKIFPERRKKKPPNLIQKHRHDVFFNPSGGFYCLLGLLISVKFFF